MKLTGLDGREYVYNFKKICRESPNPSSLHLSARSIIQEIFTMSAIYEEVQLLGSKLVADFFIPDMEVIIEVHGEQHYKHIPHFHKTKEDFYRAVARDACKKTWAEINNLSYIELPFDKINRWRRIIKEYL
jgi:hypothetical protein